MKTGNKPAVKRLEWHEPEFVPFLKGPRGHFECELPLNHKLQIVSRWPNPDVPTFRVYLVSEECDEELTIAGLGRQLPKLDFDSIDEAIEAANQWYENWVHGLLDDAIPESPWRKINGLQDCPEEGVSVLGYNKEWVSEDEPTGVYMCYLSLSSFSGEPIWSIVSPDYWPCPKPEGSPTHWMPLPDAPEEAGYYYCWVRDTERKERFFFDPQSRDCIDFCLVWCSHWQPDLRPPLYGPDEKGGPQ